MKNIVLHGMRGTGKTSVGKLLAKQLGYAFYDLDDCIGELVDGPITEYIQNQGWNEFRDREYEALKQILKKKENKVLSLGGGAIIFDRNQRLLKKKADKLIYIDSKLKNITSRIQADEDNNQKRNSLTGKGLMEELEEVYNQRKEIYEANNDIIVDNNGEITETVEQIFTKINIGSVCVPIVDFDRNTLGEILDKINKDKYIKFVELRIDFLKDMNRLEKMINYIQKKVIVTNRHYSEGGNFKGTLEESIQILAMASNFGSDYVDIELQAGDLIEKFKTKIADQSKLIISYHNFAQTPDIDSLKNVLNKMQIYGPDVYKIALMPNDKNDLEIIYELSYYFKNNYPNKDYIFISMGDMGMETRYEIPRKGGLLSFGSFATNKSAPGQIDYKMLHNLINI